MTEQEFRDALKRQVGQTGLSSDRQGKVLARMKGDKPKVKMRSKMKAALILAAVLMLGMTGAVASGLGGVNWAGEPTAPPMGIPLNSTESGKRLQALMNTTESTVLTVASKLDPVVGEPAGTISFTSNCFAESLAEMQAWVEADGGLPWLTTVPEGYTLKLGRVGYACSSEGEFEFLGAETTDDGYLLSSFQMPEEHRFMCDYFIRLIGEDEHIITVNVSMHHDTGEQVFNVTDDGSVQMMQVDGMENALCISTAEEITVAMRQQYAERITYVSPNVQPNGAPTRLYGHFGGLTVKITSSDTSFSVADLLAIFGLSEK